MIRKLKQADIEKIEMMLNSIPQFSEKEVEVAMELILIAANNPEQKDYHIFVYEEGEEIIGYHCTGQRPLTDGTYDLYWIAANPSSQIKGIGNQLLQHAENFVTERKGRWLLAETSSKENYTGTRNFYLRNNYSILCEINDFYTVGDNLLIFGKYLNAK